MLPNATPGVRSASRRIVRTWCVLAGQAGAISNEFLDILAPPRCIGCLRENTWLCLSCLSAIKFTEQSCIVCGRIRATGLTCRRCRKKSSLTGVVSAGPYSSRLLRRAIHWLKFKNVKEIAHPLAQLLIPRLVVISPLLQQQIDSVLVPVPLHQRRMNQRGFNQSRAIAEIISTYTQIPVMDLVQRQQSTLTQAKLPKEFRQQNVQAAFTMARLLPPERNIFIIIDDVTTSGSTLSAVAQTLRSAGAQEIWGATIARG